MLKLHFLFVLFSVFQSSQTSTIDQDAILQPVILNEKQDVYEGVLSSVYVMATKERDLAASDLIHDLDKFHNYKDKTFSKEKIYWFALKLQNASGADLNLTLYLGNFDFFEFHEIGGKETINIVKGGDLRPAWDMTYPGEHRNSVPITLVDGSTGTYLIKVENGEFFSPAPVFKLFTREKFEELTASESRDFWQGIFHGVLWVMIIYNIFFAFIGRDRTYLYYALYMIAISLYFMNIFGYLTKYLYPNHPEYGTYVWLAMQTAAIFYIIFVRKFLDLKKLHRGWDRISKYILIGSIIFVAFKISYFLIFKQYGILSYVSQFVLFVAAIFTIGLIVSLIRTGNRLAIYFTIGSIALGLGLLSASVISFVGEAYSKTFFNAIQIGIVFEIIFFSIGLSYKMRQSEREKRKAQEELVKQLKEHEKLQLNYQKELEQKVIERTRQIEEQKDVLEMQKYKLEEINEEKNHLISIVAHDLRNPLTSALSISQLLQSETTDEDTAEMSKVISNSLKRMNEMIEKILDIRAIESQVTKMETEAFDMVAEINGIIDQFSGRALQKDIELVVDLEQAAVQLDRNYFRQIVENLVSNAIKFSPDNRKIFINTFQSNGSSFFEVRDEGPGLTEDDKKRIFGKFQKLSARPTGGESSTGIGLSIVKKYVEAMDGLISFESVVGKGTTFRIEFSSIQ